MVRAMMRLSPDTMFGSARPADLRGRSVRGGLIVFWAQAAKFGLQTATTVVLARLLTPDDYGLVAMVTVVIAFAQMFRDAGLSAATIQHEHIAREQINSLFWVNLGISALLSACVLAAAPLVAAFYRQPQLTLMTAALSLSFLLGGVTIQHDALLRRHMLFGSLAMVQIASQVVNLVVALGLAFLGCRYWALIGGSLSATLSVSLLTLYYCPWIPQRPRRGAEIRSMLRFGGHMTGFEVVNYFGRNMDNILVGRFLGADALGLYSRAYNLFMLPISQIKSPLTQVAMPALSALSGEPQRYRRYYMSFLEAIAVLTIPLTVYCALEADLLVRVLLGPQWMGLVLTFRILAIAGMVQPLAATVGLVMQSLGHPDRQFKNGLVNTTVAIIAFIAGLPFGIAGVAAASAIASYIVMFPMLVYAYRGTPLRVSDFLRSVWRPFVASIGVGGVVLVAQRIGASDALLWHVGLTVAFFAGYTLVTLMSPSVRRTVKLFARESRLGSRLKKE